MSAIIKDAKEISDDEQEEVKRAILSPLVPAVDQMSFSVMTHGEHGPVGIVSLHSDNFGIMCQAMLTADEMESYGKVFVDIAATLRGMKN